MIYKELRQEFTRMSFRNKLKNELPNICANCGYDKNIEYHHIVPLKNDGTNKLTNIVPLCETCHYKAHDRSSFKAKNAGRPKAIEFEQAETILHRYFNLEIGTKETKELLGISSKTKSTWSRLTNEYKQKYNISSDFKNNIDLLNAQSKRIETMKSKTY